VPADDVVAIDTIERREGVDSVTRTAVRGCPTAEKEGRTAPPLHTVMRRV